MSSDNHCPQCDMPLAAGIPEGLCPKCVMQLATGRDGDERATLARSAPLEGPGTVLGPYKLLEKIGEGGMAVVYMAEQERPLRRRIALKIIKLGMDTKQVVARFEAERQALAMMDHPNIAHVFDAGATETGRPYFVMELVRGLSITEYCDRNRLDTRERLGLFIPVCNAVHHAHQKGIIHRDLKPSNIMVTLHDSQPVPMVIDFGIAKATNQRLTEQTVFTRYAEMIGTPEYMSPEQAEMSGLDVDTRTDIYSLGVVLYELLTGALPFDPDTLRSAAFSEVQRIIREEEPLRPSTRLSTLGEAAQRIAEARKTDVTALSRSLQSELEWIPLKAMRKDRSRRYHSAHEFGDDIRNYLTDVPLIAGPESASYRARKLLRKYRAPIATVALIIAVVVVGFFTSTYLYFRVRQAQRTVATLERMAEADRRLSTAQRLQAEGRYRDALDEIEAYLTRGDTTPAALLLHANLLYTLDRVQEASDELTDLLEAGPEVAGPAHCLLARIYASSAPAKAEKHRRQGETLLPETPDAYSLRGITAQDSETATRWLTRALDLNPGHYPSRKARAFMALSVRDYALLARDAEALVVGRPKDSLGYALRAIARRESGQLEAAMEDHDRAVALCDIQGELPELYNQRRETYMQMERADAALLDAKRCLSLKPDDLQYKLHVFASLLALGQFEAARTEYQEIVRGNPKLAERFKSWVSRYVFDALNAGRTFKLPNDAASEVPFCSMQEAAEQYQVCADKATLLVPHAFAQAGWSPDGKQLAYGRTDWYAWTDDVEQSDAPVIYRSSGMEILDLETGRLRQFAVTGKDPAWSPDGRYIAFNHVQRRSGYHWIARLWFAPTDGGPPRELGSGGWPIWSRTTPGRLYFHNIDAFYRMQLNDADGGRERVLSCPEFCALSPDENYVAYAAWGRVEIAQVATKMVVATWQAPPPEGNKRIYLRWSPDGKEILIAGGHESDLGLWSYDVALQEAWQIFPSPAVLATPSPDKTKLAIALREHIGGIWLADLDPNLLIRESMAPILSRAQYLRQSCRRFATSIRAGTYRPDAANYLADFIAAVGRLGRRHYRDGQYDDAMGTLGDLGFLLHALGQELGTTELAYLTMAQCRVGRHVEARANLERIRERMTGDPRAIPRDLLCELEAVAAGEETPAGRIWKWMRDGELETADTLLDCPKKTALEPDHATAQGLREALALSFYERGQHGRRDSAYAQTIADYLTAIRLDPNLARAHCDLAWLQAACPAVGFRDVNEACEHVTQACELTGWRDHRYLAALAAVCAQSEDFATAVSWQKKAIDLLTQETEAQWLGDYETRLALYGSGRPYTQGDVWSFSTGRLLGWWRFDEASGNTAVDASGNGNTGTVTGAVQWLPSGAPTGGAFLPRNGSVEVAQEAPFDVTEAISISVWTCVDKLDEWWQALVTKGDSAWRLHRCGEDRSVEFHCNGLQTSDGEPPVAGRKGSHVIDDGQWHHIVATYDGHQIALYVDGRMVASRRAWGRIQTNDYPVCIGDNAEQPGRYWNGWIDDVRIYSYALSEDEIVRLYQSNVHSVTSSAQ